MPRQPLVVLVEDQEALGSVLGELFGREGYEVVSVHDCTAARAVAKEREVDLLVLDATAAEEREPVETVCVDHPGISVIAVRNPEDVSVPFFGPWRLEGRVATLRRPFRVDDLLSAARELVAPV